MSTFMQDMRSKNPSLARAYAITGNQPSFALRNMVRALSVMQAINTPEENERLAAARFILRNNRISA